MVATSENVGIAFGLVFAAGFSTALGSAVVFVPRFVSLANRNVLAAGLGFSAGVMLYVSFVEILIKSVDSFHQAGHSYDDSHIYATLCFFVGVAILLILNSFVGRLLGGHGHRNGHTGDRKTSSSRSSMKPSSRASVNRQLKTRTSNIAKPACCAKDPVEQLSTFKKMASVLEHEQHHDCEEGLKGDDDDDDDCSGRSNKVGHSVTISSTMSSIASADDISEGDIEDQQQSTKPSSHRPRKILSNEDDDFIDNLPLDSQGRPIIEAPHGKSGSSSSPSSNCSTKNKRARKGEIQTHKVTKTKTDCDSEKSAEKDDHTVDVDVLGESFKTDDGNNKTTNEKEDAKLEALGYKTALAIALHNFPEGLATFVAALDDPRVGAILAMAIAVHNIPEGLCVSLPIYYSTGNRCKGFAWGVLSGFSEILAAIVGWLVLASAFTPTTYAILFGIVAGMMVIITVRELLPTAHFYDPDDKYVTFAFIGGMGLLALSLVLFKI